AFLTLRRGRNARPDLWHQVAVFDQPGAQDARGILAALRLEHPGAPSLAHLLPDPFRHGAAFENNVQLRPRVDLPVQIPRVLRLLPAQADIRFQQPCAGVEAVDAIQALAQFEEIVAIARMRLEFLQNLRFGKPGVTRNRYLSDVTGWAHCRGLL